MSPWLKFQKKQWIIFLILLVLVGAAIKFGLPAKVSALRPGSGADPVQVDDRIAGKPEADQPGSIQQRLTVEPAPEVLPPAEFSLATRRMISDCLKIDVPAQLPSLATVLEMKVGGTEQLEFQNFHFTTADGIKKRIHQDERTIKLLGLDSEQLPIVESELKEDDVARILSSSNLTLSQRAYRKMNSKSRANIRVELTNGRVVQLQYSSPEGSLGCSNSDCKCLTGR